MAYQEKSLESEERKNILNHSLGYSILTADYSSKMDGGPECSDLVGDVVAS